MYHFHIKHFGRPGSDCATQSGPKQNETTLPSDEGGLNEDGTYYEDDDGLGYYPDGVKRTLTDDQIAIFRHSEIYSLVRKRQIQKENRNAGDSLGDDNVAAESLDVAELMSDDADNLEPELGVVNSDGNGDEEYLKFLEAERKQMEADRKETEATAYKSRKRKLKRVDERKPYERAPTHRRIARELDDAVVSNDVLDYDDETSESPPLLKKHISSENGGERGLKEMKSGSSASVNDSSLPSLDDSPKGRKIWWPIIEKR